MSSNASREWAAPLALGFYGGLAAFTLLLALAGLLGAERGLAYAAALFFATRAVWRQVGARFGRAPAVATRGVGWAALAGLGLGSLSAPYADAAPAATALVMGTFLVAASGVAASRFAAVVALLGAAAVFAVGFGLTGRLADALPDFPRERFAWLYLAVVASVAATRLGRAVHDRRPKERRSALAAVLESEARNALVVLPFASYALFREALATNLRYFNVYEWSLGVVLAAYVLAALRGRFREAVAEEPWTLDARRHAQEVVAKDEPRYAEAHAAFEAYVERGEDAPGYVAFWSRALAEARVPDADARALLARVDAAGEPAAGGIRILLGRRDAPPIRARDKRVEVHRALLARVSSEVTRNAGQRSPRLQSHPR